MYVKLRKSKIENMATMLNFGVTSGKYNVPGVFYVKLHVRNLFLTKIIILVLKHKYKTREQGKRL